ncbi:MAG: hypothetical protein EOP48_05860 [Sphingobacteriales bacterium]|nr:MAG: hypothetical protein EOP48_05860 [Sphingobacteriales bacterium]
MTYTVVCLLTILTFIVPLLTILPLALPLELIFSAIFGDDNYSRVGKGVLVSLIIIFCISIFLFYRNLNRQLKRTQQLNTAGFILFLTLQLIIIHPLVFYVNTSKDWSQASDGQFVFGITASFPISSFAFVIIGLMVDAYKNRWLAKQPS